MTQTFANPHYPHNCIDSPSAPSPGAPGRTTAGTGFPPVARSGRGHRFLFSSSGLALAWANGIAALIALRDANSSSGDDAA
jgi:hypothetical protein